MLQPEIKVPWLFVVPRPVRKAVEPGHYHGDGHDILLQGFHWDSYQGTGPRHARKSWYRIMLENAPAIRSAGFSWVWFPPPVDSLNAQGYLPRRWQVLDTHYGNEADLRAVIQAIEPVQAMADVVLSHRVGAHTGGADFEAPSFPNNRAAVVRDDESGVGTGNPATGERYPGGRNLDHLNGDVRNVIKDHLRRLKSVGFKGWRFDQVKGYAGRFTGEYNDATLPGLAVGEFYDTDRQKVTGWIDSTGGKCMAFDFPTRYLLYDACRLDDYGRLRSTNNGKSVPGGLIGFWPSRAMTFVDNHDTEHRRDKEHEHRFNDTRHFAGPTAAMAYAYTLTHPGVPCVYWCHYFDWGEYMRQRLDRLIRVRKAAGINARSHAEIKEASQGLYAAIVDNKVAVKLGSRSWGPGHGWQLVADGEKFAVWARA